MSRNSAEDPIDPHLADWIEERVTSDADTARPLLAADCELLGLFSVAQRAAPDKMSEAEARNILAAVQRRLVAASPSPLRARDAVMAVAAVLVGLVIGLIALAPPDPGGDRRAMGTEIIKKVSFESTHEGKVVRFQLKLTRVR